MKNTIRTVLSFMILSFAFLQVQAQKIGYVDSQAVIADMAEVKEANSNLETYGSQLQKRAEQMYKSLETKAATLQQKRDGGELSPKQLEIEMANLQKEEQKLIDFQSSSQNDIAAKQNELLQPILDRVQVAIDEVAAAEEYTYIFDSSQGVILYADDSTNITSKVKAKLGM